MSTIYIPREHRSLGRIKPQEYLMEHQTIAFLVRLHLRKHCWSVYLFCQQSGGRQIQHRKDTLVLISRTWEYITFHENKDFAYMIESWIFKWESYPGLSGWAQSLESKGKRRAKDQMTEAEVILEKFLMILPHWL